MKSLNSPAASEASLGTASSWEGPVGSAGGVAAEGASVVHTRKGPGYHSREAGLCAEGDEEPLGEGAKHF